MSQEQKTTIIPPVINSVTTTRSKITKRNVNRVAIYIVNQGTAQIRIGVDETLTSSSGLPIPSGGQRFLNIIEDEALVKGELWAISESGTNNVEVVETVRA